MVAGNSLAQTTVSATVVGSAILVTLIVLIVSQQVVLVIVRDNDPIAANTWPKIVAGNSLAQTAVSTTVVGSAMLVTLIVLIVSQPIVDGTVSVNEPGA